MSDLKFDFSSIIYLLTVLQYEESPLPSYGHHLLAIYLIAEQIYH